MATTERARHVWMVRPEPGPPSCGDTIGKYTDIRESCVIIFVFREFLDGFEKRWEKDMRDIIGEPSGGPQGEPLGDLQMKRRKGLIFDEISF